MIRRDPPPALFVRPDQVRDAVRAAILIRAITPELNRRAEALKPGLRRSSRFVARPPRPAKTCSPPKAPSPSAAPRSKVWPPRRWRWSARPRRRGRGRPRRRRPGGPRAGPARSGPGPRRQPAARLAHEPPDPEHGGLFGGREAFTAPVSGPPSRRFGQPEPNGGPKSLGWTWRIDRPVSVVAPATGVVEYAGPLKGWGVVLILRLGGGYHLVLAGLETALAAPGRMVKSG